MFWDYIKITDISAEDFAATYALLDPTRKEHIDSLKNEKDRLCSLGGEILAKKLLREHCKITQPIIKRDNKGKPYIENSNFHISISHCDQTVVCAVHNAPLGIDIERIRPVKDPLVSRVCTADEQAYLAAAQGESERLSRFFEVWTAKEAYFKRLGTGITTFKSVNILGLDRKIIRMEDYVIQIVI